MPPVRGKKSSRGYADMAAALARSREKSAKAKSKAEKEETPQPQPSVSSVRSNQSSQRRYYSPYHQASVKSKKVNLQSSTSTPHTATSSGLELQESPRFSNTFKEARRAVCDLYTIWKHEYDEKEKQLHQQPSSSNAENEDKGRKGGMGKYEDKRKFSNDDGKLELSSKAVEYLQETIKHLEEETAYMQVSMDAFHKGMISVMDKNKGVDIESINKKSLREKGVPLKELKTSRTELHKEEKDRDLEKKLEESQKKYSDVVAQLCEAQNKISEQDLDLRSILGELEDAKRQRKALSEKCVSLNSQLDEEVNRSSETLKELQKSQGSKDGQVQSLIDGMQSRLDSKSQQCNELQDELAHFKEDQELYKKEIANLKKEMQTKEEESGKKLELTRSDVERLNMEYKALKDSISLEDEETSLKLEAALDTIKRQASECENLKDALGDSEAKTSEALQSLYEKENELLQLSEKEGKFNTMQKDIEAKIKEMQGLNEDLSSTLADIGEAKHLSSILTDEINKGLQNYLDDLVEAKTPRSICSSANPFSQSVGNRDSTKSRTVEEEEEEKEKENKKEQQPQSLDQILSSNGMRKESTTVFVKGAEDSSGGSGDSGSESLATLYSFLSELGIVEGSDRAAESKATEELLDDIKVAIKGVISKSDEMKLVAQQQEMDFIKSEETSKSLQEKLRKVESELEDLKFQPEISIGSAVVSPSRSRSHTVDNAVFKEHASLSELPELMIREDEDIQFSSSDEDEVAAGPDSPVPRKRDRTFSSARGSKSMFLRQNSNQITEGIAEDLRIENDSLRIKLTQLELEKEGLTKQLKEKEKEIGKQTTREMETIRRASVMYDSKAQQSQKGFWQGKRNRGSSNAEDMQTLVNDLTNRYSELSLKFAEKCSEADELKYELKTKDVEIGAIKELYAIPDILEQNNNVWVSFRVFIPGDDEKGIATSLLVGTDGIYIPHWVDQQFYDYTTIAKFEVRDNEFVFWCLTTTSRKLNEVNLYCNAVLPNAILSSIQSAIKMKLEVHNTATSSITVG